MKAIFSPGPSFHNPEVRKVAGWVGILDLYKQGLEELGYEVFIPEVPGELIDQSSTVSKILSYDIVAAREIRRAFWGEEPPALFLGPPGYSLTQMMCLPNFNPPERLVYVWNNADWYRDEQLINEYSKANWPYDQSPTWRWINREALQLADHVIACSPWVKKTHAEVVPAEKISITPWGVDSVKFCPNPELANDGPMRVLFVGGDPIRKGLVYLADAIMQVPNIELWVAGCEWPFHKTSIDGRVRSWGGLLHDDMPTLMQQCDVICIPTLEDGIACALQEGMACGLVPVTTPEAAEVFVTGDYGIHDLGVFRADEGFIVGYRSVEGIVSALGQLRDNPELRRQMSEYALQSARSLTWEHTKESFKEVIQKNV